MTQQDMAALKLARMFLSRVPVQGLDEARKLVAVDEHLRLMTEGSPSVVPPPPPADR